MQSLEAKTLETACLLALWDFLYILHNDFLLCNLTNIIALSVSGCAKLRKVCRCLDSLCAALSAHAWEIPCKVPVEYCKDADRVFVAGCELI